MAYLINTSKTAATTVNLSQGRVCIRPQSFTEVVDADIDTARKFYNSKELNLFLAESKEEMDLILGSANVELQENADEVQTNADGTDEQNKTEDSEQNGDEQDSQNAKFGDSEGDQDKSDEENSDETVNNQKTTDETKTENENSEDEEDKPETKEDESEAENDSETENNEDTEELSDEEKQKQEEIKVAIIKDIAKCREDNKNIQELKRIATNIDITFAPNIKFDTLEAKIISYLDKQ